MIAKDNVLFTKKIFAFPEQIKPIRQLYAEYGLQAVEDAIARLLFCLELEHIELDGTLFNLNPITTKDKKWIFGYKRNLQEVFQKAFITPILIFRLLTQHPGYIGRMRILRKEDRLKVADFKNCIQLSVPIANVAVNFLLGYSQNHRIPKDKNPIFYNHALGNLLQLYAMEIRDWGELGVLSIFARLKRELLLSGQEAICKSLDKKLHHPEAKFTSECCALIEEIYDHVPKSAPKPVPRVNPLSEPPAEFCKKKQ